MDANFAKLPGCNPLAAVNDALLVQLKPDDAVTLEVLRDGTPLQVTVTLGTRPGNL